MTPEQEAANHRQAERIKAFLQSETPNGSVSEALLMMGMVLRSTFGALTAAQSHEERLHLFRGFLTDEFAKFVEMSKQMPRREPRA